MPDRKLAGVTLLKFGELTLEDDVVLIAVAVQQDDLALWLFLQYGPQDGHQRGDAAAGSEEVVPAAGGGVRLGQEAAHGGHHVDGIAGL